MQFNLTGCGRGDAAENLEQSTLARAVASDNADDFALRNIERNIAQSPELFARLSVDGAPQPRDERFAQRRGALLVNNRVTLGKLLDADRRRRSTHGAE